jgi:hypothetical protein
VASVGAAHGALADLHHHKPILPRHELLENGGETSKEHAQPIRSRSNGDIQMEGIVLGHHRVFVGIEGITPAYLWKHYKVLLFHLDSGELAAAVPNDAQSLERHDLLVFCFNVEPKRCVAEESEMLAIVSDHPDVFPSEE